MKNKYFGVKVISLGMHTNCIILEARYRQERFGILEFALPHCTDVRTCYLPPATCYLLPATCYLLPATCYLLPAERWLSSADARWWWVVGGGWWVVGGGWWVVGGGWWVVGGGWWVVCYLVVYYLYNDTNNLVSIFVYRNNYRVKGTAPAP
jgi:hypothetical protein